LSGLLWLAATIPAFAEENWRSRAFLDVPAPGLIEAVLPAGLVNRMDRDRMDLVLNGPDGHPRAFELFWREPVGEIRQLLQPARVQLDPATGFIWESELKEEFLIKRLYITLAPREAIGKIDVFGKIADQWVALARNAAVFTGADTKLAQIEIPANTYAGFKLHITAYDPKAQKTLSPIKTVMVEGERLGKDYAQEELNLTFETSESEGTHVIEAVLPGEGLWINSLALNTEAQFQGDWQAGYERISGGSRNFEALAAGRLAHVHHTPRSLEMPIDQAWPSRSLVVKLDAGRRYLGDVVSLTAVVRLPRLVFVADKPGRYLAISGEAKGVSVLNFPGDRYRKTDSQLDFSTPEENPGFRLSTLLEKFKIKGGPFSAKGYTWHALVDIPAPGYYRLALNLEASLAPRPTAIRMVKDDTQVPYVMGRPQDQTLELSCTPDHDAQKNLSTFVIRLPQASAHWKELIFHASGIFKRNVEFEKPKPGTRNWQLWQRMLWESRGQRETALHLSLRDLSDDTDEIRLVMAHGDNQPVAISKITATYTAPTVYFLAAAAGSYTIYGGNPDATPPQYDLSLVQDELFATLPLSAEMGELKIFRQAGWQTRFIDAFKDKGWGLYAVLGLLTVVLLIVIVRLFPKPAN
jgi:hypothetical protein